VNHWHLQLVVSLPLEPILSQVVSCANTQPPSNQLLVSFNFLYFLSENIYVDVALSEFLWRGFRRSIWFLKVHSTSWLLWFGTHLTSWTRTHGSCFFEVWKWSFSDNQNTLHSQQRVRNTAINTFTSTANIDSVRKKYFPSLRHAKKINTRLAWASCFH